MRELIIDANSAGLRLDRFLGKYMAGAPASFFYKMMRKKNITLNGKKCEGPERLAEGDTVRLYLAEETIGQFRQSAEKTAGAGLASGPRARLNIIYEDKHILLVNKPAGMLSQKAAAKDVSLNEHILRYLLESGKITEEQLELFRPSVCNRLDRNTSGLVICGKTLAGSREMSALLRDRSLKKRYLCLVDGVLKGERRIHGYLKKNEQTNRVTVKDHPFGEAVPIDTVYRNLADNGRITLLEVELITGKSHQIRAHLADIGHGIIGDAKYGDETVNRLFRERYDLRVQLLHAWKVNFPEMKVEFAPLSGRQFTAPPWPVMKRILTGEGLWLPGIQED